MSALNLAVLDADDGDSGIPAAYTYFGQFVDYDIILRQRGPRKEGLPLLY
jgi:hypothetical protein